MKQQEICEQILISKGAEKEVLNQHDTEHQKTMAFHSSQISVLLHLELEIKTKEKHKTI